MAKLTSNPVCFVGADGQSPVPFDWQNIAGRVSLAAMILSEVTGAEGEGNEVRVV